MHINNNTQWSKRTRLKSFDYIGPYRYFVTVSVYDKKVLFRAADVVDMTYGVLCEYSEKARFRVLAFCFMPDHLHFLTEGQDGESNLKSFISRFKQVSGYRYKSDTGQKLWQSSYYEHVLREEEASEKVSEYILENPVRGNLVAHYLDYPYSGSIWQKPLSGLKP
ncbi:MAG TPA: hypothetical protein DE036_01760 [Actinobacteria bacterium]|nr:hypothetical protein [Actinomycetota bacterium]